MQKLKITPEDAVHVNSHLDETADEFGAFIEGAGSPETHLENFTMNMYVPFISRTQTDLLNINSETRHTEVTTHTPEEDHLISQFVLSNDNAIADASEESVRIIILSTYWLLLCLGTRSSGQGVTITSSKFRCACFTPATTLAPTVTLNYCSW